MIVQYNREDLHEENTKKNVEEPTRKRKIFVSLAVLAIVIVAIAGSWYLLQPEHSGTLAPNFSLTDVNGNAFRLNDFRGSVVVIDFMSTTCTACRLSMPELEEVWNEYEERIVMVTISVTAPPFDDTEEMIRNWMSEFGSTWIHGKDTTGVTFDYRVMGIPTVVIIDKYGYIRFTYDYDPITAAPSISAETISQRIEELL